MRFCLKPKTKIKTIYIIGYSITACFEEVFFTEILSLVFANIYIHGLSFAQVHVQEQRAYSK